MKLDEIVTWYQKKIGTYDVQQWEKTVEQKILDGFSSSGTSLKTAKLKTELIDVDLVRGSTFPKAKPKQSLLTVIRLAILRYFFLPVYANWWVRQTSPHAFTLLLILYISQMINWAVYTFHIHRLTAENSSYVLGNISDTNSTLRTIHQSNHDNEDPRRAAGVVGGQQEITVSMSDLLIPIGLSFLLSLIHSQIVATNTASSAKTKRKRFSNAGLSAAATKNRGGGDLKGRRRKKLVKTRSQEVPEVANSHQQQQQRKSNVLTPTTFGLKKLPSATCSLSNENLMKTTPSNTPSLSMDVMTLGKNASQTTTTTASVTHSQSFNSSCCDKETHSTSTVSSLLHPSPSEPQIEDLNKIASSSRSSSPTKVQGIAFTSLTSEGKENETQKSRNIKWNSPLHKLASSMVATHENQENPSPQSAQSSSTTNSDANTPCNPATNCASSSTSTNASNHDSPNKQVRIDDCVQEVFYDNATCVSHEDVTVTTRGELSSLNLEPMRRLNGGEDDGFESLNGKSSSGEDNNSPMPLSGGASTATAASASMARSHLRLRLNAGNYRQAQNVEASSEETDEDGGDDDNEGISSPNSFGNLSNNYAECTTSATEWLGVTTNSDDCSYSSELDNADPMKNQPITDEDYTEVDYTPTVLLNAPGSTDRISCAIWEGHEAKKAQMSVLDISSCIIERVEAMPETYDYIYIGAFFSVILTFVPCFCRLFEITLDDMDKTSEISYLEVPLILWEKASFSFLTVISFAFGDTNWERCVLIVSFMQRLCLTCMLFLLFSVAERTFKQRFLYAKLFSHLTSSRRARKSNLPHFRLNKVRNIKTWLSVRSYLKKRGPQRSVDVIVSTAFLVTLLLLAFLSVEWLKDSVQMHSHLNLEALMWSTTIGIFLVRFMTLGNKIHEKYRSVSVLITEQINLYLQIEQKPKKKDELMVANSVLKLAADLLKELESPFKISGLSANPYLFTTIKVVILSALSGVLSEMLGFKLKLHKIKIK